MKSISAFCPILALVLASSVALAEVPQLINYQGRLTDHEGNLLDTTISITFAIYDDSADGTLFWTEVHSGIMVVDGLFSIMLGSISPIDGCIFNAQDLYLGITVGGDAEITPRTRIMSVGYAYYAQRADTAAYAQVGNDGDWIESGDDIYRLEGNVGIGTATPGFRLSLTGSDVVASFGSNISAVRLADSSETYVGGYQTIEGQTSTYLANNLFYTSAAHWIRPNPDNATATLILQNGNIVFKTGATDLGDTRLTILNDGKVGIGTIYPAARLHVAGDAHFAGDIEVRSADAIQEIRLKHSTDLPSYQGALQYAYDYNNAVRLVTWSDNRQVFGASADASQVFFPNGNVGIGTTNPSYKLDVIGDIRSTGTIHGNFSGTIDNALHWNGYGWGDTYPNSDKVDNLHGTQMLRNDQSGILNGELTVNGPGGSVNAVTGNTGGTYSGIAGLNSGAGPGVYGESHATMSEIGGVTGKAKADGGSGVYGETWSLGKAGGSSCAVYGWAPEPGAAVGGAALGVLGRVNSYQDPDNSSVPCGIFGWATATSGTNAGVWGETESPNGFGVYSAGDLAVDGDFNCNGTKNAIVPTSSGDRAVYCQESPEVWFEDFGEGQLSNGLVHIELDEMFLETVTIDKKFPMKVFIQLNGDCNGVYVERGMTGFDVIELANGSSDAAFTFRVVAKRKGYENCRFELKENFRAARESERYR